MHGCHSPVALLLFVHQYSGYPLFSLKKEVTNRGEEDFFQADDFGPFHVLLHWGPASQRAGPGQGGRIA